MKNITLWISLPLLLILGFSCNMDPCGINKKHFQSNFERFVDQVKEEKLTYDDQKWVKYDAKFRKLTEECYKKYEDEMNAEEKEAFFSTAISYYWQRYGSGFVNQLLDKDSEVVQNILEHLRQSWEETDSKVDDWIGDLKIELDNIDKEELRQLFENIGSDMEEWGKKLEEIFKEQEKK